MSLPRDPDTLRIPAFMRTKALSRKLKKKLPMTALDRKEAGLPPPGLEPARKRRTTSSRGTGYGTTRSRTATSSRANSPAPARERSFGSQRNMWDLAIERIHREKNPGAHVMASSPLKRRPTTPSPARRPTAHTTQPRLPARPVQHQPTRPLPAAPRYEDRGYEQQLNTYDAHEIPDDEFYARPEIVEAEPQAATFVAVGKVTQYFAKINVAVIELDETLSVGDIISYQTPDGPYEQIVTSMEIDRQPIFKAEPGDDIGMKLEQPAVVGETLYRG